MGEHRHTGSTIDLGENELQAQLGELLIGLADQMRVHVMATAAADGLTMPQVMVMRLLDRERPMRELADEMHYDASTITALVDRLEERGLAQRRPHPTDRRVRMITLTDLGRSTQSRIERDVFKRLPLLDQLTVDQQVMLRDLLVAAVNPD